MKIFFTPQAFQKIRAYVDGIPYEISGFGKVTKTHNIITIEDIKIFPQTVTAGNTVMDAQALAAFWDELMVAGEDIGAWKLWWHSHVDMTARFSGTDYATIEEFDNESPEENWILSIVTNKQGDAYARIDIFDPIRCGIGNVAIDVLEGEMELIDVSQEIAEKVTVARPRLEKHIEWESNHSLLSARKTLLTEEERKLLQEKYLSSQQAPVVLDKDIIILGPDGKPIDAKN